MMVDFHIHTTASDGTLTPEQLVGEIGKRSIPYFAITDHDTIDGLEILEKIPKNLTPVTGVEISAEFDKTLHILGYGFDPKHPDLTDSLNELQDYRKARNRQILEKMRRYGMVISMAELIDEAGSDLVGRPHFAALMVRKGYVDPFQEAFDRYLKKGAPLYMDKKRFDPDKAIDMIHAAGGIAVMAHPYQTKLEGRDLENLVKELVSYGLDGIEVFYSQHTPQMICEYKGYARQYDLIATGGSDFHGANKPHIPLGVEVNEQDIQPFVSFVSQRKRLYHG